jgi:hypothetical protein
MKRGKGERGKGGRNCPSGIVTPALYRPDYNPWASNPYRGKEKKKVDAYFK